MRKLAIFGIVTAIAAIVSASLVTASYKSSERRMSSVDPTEITLNARNLPLSHITDPF
jgi:hypothetical protein